LHVCLCRRHLILRKGRRLGGESKVFQALFVAFVEDDTAEVGRGFHQVLKAVIPVGGGLEEEHDALMREAELQVAGLANMFDQGFGIVEIDLFVFGKGMVAKLLEQNGDIGLLQNHLRHGDQRRTSCLGVFNEVFPAVHVVFFKKYRGDFFGDVGGHAAKSVASDERDHVVFKREKVFRLHQPLFSQNLKACAGFGTVSAMLYFDTTLMIFSKDYVGYLARQTVKQLIASKMISTQKPEVLNARVTTGMVDELSLEDRINDEVRVILEAIQEDMRKGGVSYPEMFKKVKLKLVHQYKAVL
jgi:hypothetical protein